MIVVLNHYEYGTYSALLSLRVMLGDDHYNNAWS